MIFSHKVGICILLLSMVRLNISEDVHTCNTTTGGPQEHIPCIFPFIFRDKIYNGCTLDGRRGVRTWCSTKVDFEGFHMGGQGNWGWCEIQCPTDPDPDPIGNYENITRTHEDVLTTAIPKAIEVLDLPEDDYLGLSLITTDIAEATHEWKVHGNDYSISGAVTTKISDATERQMLHENDLSNSSMSFSRLKGELEDGMRLPIPLLCPIVIVDIMMNCWSVNPDDRPCFSNIKATLKQMVHLENMSNNKEAGSLVDEIHYSTIIFDTKTAKEQFTAIQRSNPYYENLKTQYRQDNCQDSTNVQTTYSTIDTVRTAAYNESRREIMEENKCRHSVIKIK